MSAPLRACLVLSVAAALAGGCADQPEAASPVQPRAAKSPTALTVTAANPTYGDLGQTSEQVTIAGTGFAPGAQAEWALKGVVTPDVQVVSTQYVSSTQLVATINIAAGASIALYDVVVTSSGKKGIGTELFEVTQAFAITGMTSANGTNDAGLVVGNMPGKNGQAGHPALWTPDFPGARTGTITDLGSVPNPGATPENIDQAGTVIVGEGGPAYYWLKTGSGWSPVQELPHDPSTTVGYARGLASDPVTGVARWVGGQERYSTGPQPRMWSYDASTRTFTRIVLPIPAGATGGRVRGVNISAEGTGAAPLANGDVAAAFWAADGTAVLLPPAGGSSAGNAISPDGSMIVGNSGGHAVFWSRQPDGTWSAPYLLPGSCGDAAAVDASGRIIGTGCSNGARSFSVAWLPPYTATLPLGGLGDKSDAGWAKDISPSGNNIVGSAPIAGKSFATVWKVF